MWWVLVGLVLLWSSEASSVDVSCRDETDKAVDWYILYKAPKIQKKGLTGLEYIYIDSSGKRVMKPSTDPKKPNDYKPINDGDGVLANTLRPMLKSVRDMDPSFGFLSYSDQPPGCSADIKKFGHSKGVVLGDSVTQTALWLTHSTPQFPFKRDQNKFYPDTGVANGQTFMCVTLKFTELSAIGKHLQHIRAFPFDHDLPIGFPRELRDAANWVQISLPKNTQDLTTKGKKTIKILSKKVYDPNTEEEPVEGDLYVQLTAEFKSHMKAQTWGGQSKKDSSFCDTGRYQVLNVEKIRTELGEWVTGSDHSKWAVTTAADIIWTCIGDMNRACSQYERTGGALCIQDKSVNGFFKGFVSSAEECEPPPKRLKCKDFKEMESLSDSFHDKLEL